MIALACVVALGCSSASVGGDVDAGPSDAGVDAQVPDARSPLAHCSPEAALDPWVSVNPDAHADADCGDYVVQLTGLSDGVVRIRYAPRTEATNANASWAVQHPLSRAEEVRVTMNNSALELCTSFAVVTVAHSTCALTVRDLDGRELVADGGDVARTADAWTIHRDTPAGERFYGFGEKTGALDKRGQRLVFWNTDAYDPALGGFRHDQDPLYLSIPFFVGVRGDAAYGLFTDSPARVEMDMAKQHTDRYQVIVRDDTVDQYLVVGPQIAQVVRRYTALTGRTKLPPRWALGYHQSRWGYESATRIEQLADRFRSENIPADALWLDIQHMDGFRTFTWHPGEFADPNGLSQRLADRGFKVVAIADPGIKVDDDWAVYTSGVSGDHFLRRPSGEIYEGTAWPGASSFPDFTKASTRAWWAELVGDQVDRGLRGIWLDVNEPTIFPEGGGDISFPGDVPVDNDGRGGTMARVHNAYASAEARATYDGMLAAAPHRRPFILSRAGYAGIQRHAAIWTGDVVSDWNGLRGSLPMLLNMGLSGVPFVGSDVGGYSGYASPELFARWMALGSISPFFRGHVTSNVPGQEPWQFGTEVRDISRSLIEQRYRLLPYLYSLMRESSLTGAPPLRPLIYDFQTDSGFANVSDQAMLGPFVLAAPVLEPGVTSRQVRLPAGRWYDYYSGAIYEGPTTIDVSLTLAALPLFVRDGAIIPHGPVLAHVDAPTTEPLRLDVYPAVQASSFTLYQDTGDGHDYRTADQYSAVTYTVQRLASGARVSAGGRQGNYVPPDSRLRIRVRRVDTAPTVVMHDGVELARFDDAATLELAGHGWLYDPRDLSVLIALPGGADFELDVRYDPTISDPSPPVAVRIDVTVPPGTPTGTPIFVATSANAWTHEPLSWTDANTASGTVMVPRGEWFEYKYSRGDWDTVEKWPDCAEADNRYRLGTADRTQVDDVFGWRDWCP